MIEKTSTMCLLMKGDSNWDYYYDPIDSGIYSIAKEGSGASNSIFGNASYFHLFVKKYNHHDKLTTFGKEFFHNYKDYMKKNSVVYC